MTRPLTIHVIDDWQGIAPSLADWSSLGADARVHFHRETFASEDAAAAALNDATVIVPMRERTRFTASLLSRLPDLQLLALTGKGTAHLDMDEIRRLGIALAWSGVYSPAATSELTLALMLAAARRLPQADTAVRSGRFQADVPPGITLAGKTLGIVGLGHIGKAVVRLGRALGMRIVAWSPNLTSARAAEAEIEAATLDALMAQSDVVSLHLRHDHGAPPIVTGAHIAVLKRGAILVNTSRAGVVDMAAVIAAAQSGQIIAALDVYDREPLPADDPIARCPNTVLTPHLGFAVQSSMEAFYRQSVENIAAWRDGRDLRRIDIPAPASETGT